MYKRAKAHHIQLRFGDKHYKLAKLLSLRLGKSVQATFEGLLEGACMDGETLSLAKGIGVDVSDEERVRAFLSFAPDNMQSTVMMLVRAWEQSMATKGESMATKVGSK